MYNSTVFHELAKKGLNPSQIGVILRDSNGVAQVQSVTGQKIVRIQSAFSCRLRLMFEDTDLLK